MIALDTNVLIRYIVGDHPAQSARAATLIEDELTPDRPGLITVVVIVELSWVLRGLYGASAQTVREIVHGLLGSRQILVENAAVVERAIGVAHEDLAAALIHEVGKAAGCENTVTFDRRFARLAGVERLGG